MPPTLALLLWLVLLLGLLRLDPAKDSGTSWAGWVSVFWMFIMESRLPAQWLGVAAVSGGQAFEEGNPLDRTINFGVILLSVCILAGRSFRWGDFFAHNRFLTAFLLFSLVSLVWSDLPLVAAKRWIRDLGNYLVILIVLSEADPVEAVRTFLRRLYYVLISLSVLLVKYYPGMAVVYNPWTGAPEYVGAGTSKNMLGAMCMLSGIFFFWDTVTRWSDRKERRTKQIMLVNASFIAMTLWLLNLSNSATSLTCLIIGSLVIIMANSKWTKHRTSFLKTVIPVVFLLYVLLAFGLDLKGDFAGMVGRDPTLTDRTIIWAAVLGTNTNPLIGTGYESFWLGPRLYRVWELAGPVGEAHNGYLEVYLCLGIIGLILLGGLIVSSYGSVCRRLTQCTSLGSLALTWWTIALFYNMTEAAFKPPMMCLTFLLGTVSIPVGQRVQIFRKLSSSETQVSVRKGADTRAMAKWDGSRCSTETHEALMGKPIR